MLDCFVLPPKGCRGVLGTLGNVGCRGALGTLGGHFPLHQTSRGELDIKLRMNSAELWLTLEWFYLEPRDTFNVPALELRIHSKVGVVFQPVILPKSPTFLLSWMLSLEVIIFFSFYKSLGKGFSGSSSLHLFSQSSIDARINSIRGSNLIEPVPTHRSCGPIHVTPSWPPRLV